MSRNQGLEKKFLKYGLSTFENVEILDLLLSLRIDNKSHRALGERLDIHYSTLSEILDESPDELRKVYGFKEQYLLGLYLPHQVANRYLYEKAKEKPIIRSSDAVFDYLKHSMSGLKVEYLKVIFLNGMNSIIANEDMSHGTLNYALVYPREIIKAALKHNAAAMILAHNHPAGNLNPSQEDIKLTRTLRDASKLMDIIVLDHIIIANDKYFSFAESGYMNGKNDNIT